MAWRTYLLFGGIVVLALLWIGSWRLVPTRPQLWTRILITVSGAILALSGVFEVVFARPAEIPWIGILIGVLGCNSLLQGMFFYNRRLRAIIGGAGMTIAGVCFAAPWLSPDDPLFALRNYQFAFGEFFVITGAVCVVGAWQGWLLPPPMEDDEQPRDRIGISPG